MFIAHLPAGYLLTRFIQDKARNPSRSLMWVGLLASIFPDFDLLYFYLIDNRQTEHHRYFVHMPITWLILAGLAWLLLFLTKKTRYSIYIVVALANLLLHLCLDSVAANIYWLYPLSETPVNLVEVPARYDGWVWNFFLHWTFALEMLIVIAAIYVGNKRRARL